MGFMPEARIAAPRDATLHTHGCGSAFVESVPVTEKFNGVTGWQGAVCVFELVGHPTATRANAWSAAVPGLQRGRFVTELHVGPVDSRRAAVRNSIIAEHCGR